MVTTVNQRALVALNDALRVYPFRVRATYHSAYLGESHQTIVLPKKVDRVLEVRALNASSTGFAIASELHHIPTEYTNLLNVGVSSGISLPAWLHIDYEYTPGVIPEANGLSANLAATGTVVQVPDPSILPTEWDEEGYLELHSNTGPGYIEIVHYSSINPNVGFFADMRGLKGTTSRAWAVNASVTVNPVIVIPYEAEASLMAEAEANMFAFWISHRAMYDQYTAVMGFAALDVKDLLSMVRTLEDRARRRATRVQKSMAPSRAKVSKRNDL